MKETEFFYEPCVDEAQTIRNMKRQLVFEAVYGLAASAQRAVWRGLCTTAGGG